jgi:prephenate dehydratase
VTRVAFQGELGAFSELAILQYWGDDGEPVPCREFTDVTRAVLTGAVDAGVLPLDNTTIGPITAARAALADTPLAITGETRVPIHPLLLALPGVPLDDIRHVTSHPAALGQCAAFLTSHPEWTIIPSYDTAGAARDLVRSGDTTRAVIASAAAAQRYALAILQSGIGDRADNTTRFVVIVGATASQSAP